nr:cellulose biosynthesis protein BcsF [Enterobacter hormaechei]
MPLQQCVILCVLVRKISPRYNWLYRIRLIARIMFIKPRYVKPAGVLRRESFVKADRKHD